MAWLPDGENNFEDMFIHFDRIDERDRRRDGRTDTHTHTHTAHDGLRSIAQQKRELLYRAPSIILYLEVEISTRPSVNI